MERETIIRWLEEHPGAVDGDVEELVSRCERSVRRHAREDAWRAARRYVSHRQEEWKDDVGLPASEAFVARELCSQLAYELKRHEPSPHPGDEDHLAGGVVKAAVDREGWDYLVRWILELAREEEHEAWREVVRFTRHRAGELIDSNHLSDDNGFDHARFYGDIAEQILGLMAREYSVQAFRR